MPGRAELLQRCRASLEAQTDPDWRQTVMVDDVGRGFDYARELLVLSRLKVYGRYALILDDDDVMADPDGVAALKAVAIDVPPAVIFRGRHAELGILPAHHWQARPVMGDIGAFDFILRADVYCALAGTPGPSAYAADHALIEAVYDRHGADIVWLDRVICAADKRRIGAVA